MTETSTPNDEPQMRPTTPGREDGTSKAYGSDLDAFRSADLFGADAEKVGLSSFHYAQLYDLDGEMYEVRDIDLDSPEYPVIVFRLSDGAYFNWNVRMLSWASRIN